MYWQIIGIPMDTSYALLDADLFLFYYERDFMLSLSDNNQADILLKHLILCQDIVSEKQLSARLPFAKIWFLNEKHHHQSLE